MRRTGRQFTDIRNCRDQLRMHYAISNERIRTVTAEDTEKTVIHGQTQMDAENEVVSVAPKVKVKIKSTF